MTGYPPEAAPLATLPAPMGGQIGYRVVGTGMNWLVLIHGWCGDADQWNAVLPDLASRYRILAVSQPGFGGMAAPPSAGRRIIDMATAIACLMAHLDIGKAILVGHSMGGPIMAEVAILAPERVQALLGLDTLTDRNFYGRVPDREISRRRRDFASDYPGRMRAMINAITHPSTDAATRRAITDGMLASAPADFALDVMDHLLAWDAEERWPLVSRPALLLNSTLVVRLAASDPMACFNGIAVVEYDSGHFPMLEAPAMIVEKLEVCLDRLVYGQLAC